VKNGKCLKTLPAHSDPVTAVGSRHLYADNVLGVVLWCLVVRCGSWKWNVSLGPCQKVDEKFWFVWRWRTGLDHAEKEGDVTTGGCVFVTDTSLCVCVCGWCLMLMVDWQACCHCSSTRAFLETWLWQHQDVVGSGSLLTETVWLWCLVAGQLQPWWLSHCLQQLWWTLVSRSDNCASYSLWFRSVICPQLVYVELSVIVNVDIIDVVVEFGTRRPGSASRRWLASVCVVWLYASVSIIITVFSRVLSHAPRAGSGAVSK